MGGCYEDGGGAGETYRDRIPYTEGVSLRFDFSEGGKKSTSNNLPCLGVIVKQRITSINT